MDTGNIKMPETFPIPWTQLNYLWNPHINDNRGIPQNARFFHAAMFKNRLEAMKHRVSTLNIN